MEQITITLDKSLKLQVEDSLVELGLTWTEFFHQSLLNNIPNAETIKAIRDIEEGRDVGKFYNNMNDFWTELEEENADT